MISKERPILFSGAMVRALREDRKTQTRRVVKRQFGADAVPAEMCAETTEGWQTIGHSGRWWDDAGALAEEAVTCPYGMPGDRLWVRETWAQPAALDPGPTVYRADYPACVPAHYANVPPADAITWKPSIHMPRALSRISLEVIGVRVERLQDISEDDATAEGVESIDSERDEADFSICRWCGGTRLYTAISGNGGALPDTDCLHCDTHIKRYAELWDSLNAGRGFGWEVNPWVWVVEFRRIECST